MRADEGTLGSGRRRFSPDVAEQPDIAGQADQVVDGVLPAPGHQLLASEAGIGTPPDADLGPTLAQLAHDARDLLNRAGGRVDVGGPQLGAQQVIAAEDIERQAAVVVAVEEPALLVAVQRIVAAAASWPRPLRGWSRRLLARPASRSSTTSSGGAACAPMNNSTNSRSIAFPS